MISLVFSKPSPPKDDSPQQWNTQYKDTKATSSWWVGISRDSWAGKVWENWTERLRYQRAIPEPTAKKEVPDWQRRWDERRTAERRAYAREGSVERRQESDPEDAA